MNVETFGTVYLQCALSPMVLPEYSSREGEPCSGRHHMAVKCPVEAWQGGAPSRAHHRARHGMLRHNQPRRCQAGEPELTRWELYAEEAGGAENGTLFCFSAARLAGEV
jgi:hypothetical protein